MKPWPVQIYTGWPVFCTTNMLRWFSRFKWLRKIKRRIIFHDFWKLYGIPISLSIHKVLLEHICSHMICLCIVHGCFHATVTELSNCNKRPYDPQRLTYLLSGQLRKKTILDPCFRLKIKNHPCFVPCNSLRLCYVFVLQIELKEGMMDD